MGSGSYSDMAYRHTASSRNYANASAQQLFNSHVDYNTQTSAFNTDARQYNQVKAEMASIGVRECRDSEEHPNTTPIIIAFDVTGSMGRIPHAFIKEQLPKIMSVLQESNIPDPQILFMAVGDHYSDSYPIQAGQFEADTEKILNSVQSLYLEGGGGGNGGESYSLAHIIAGYHTETDSWYKRHKKGFMFTIGDEPVHSVIEEGFLIHGLGYESGVKDISTTEAIDKAKEQYHVFHIHVTDGCHKLSTVTPKWQELLGDNFLHCHSNDISKIIASTIRDVYNQENEEVETVAEETVETAKKRVL